MKDNFESVILHERLSLTKETPFDNQRRTYLPVSYGTGRLFYSFVKGQVQKISLTALEKDGNIYRLDYLPHPLPVFETNAGFLDFQKEVSRIEKEVNEYVVDITAPNLSERIATEAKRDAEGFLFRLKNNRGENKIHTYLTIKAVKELGAPINVSVDAAVEIFLGMESVRGYANNFKAANKFSDDFHLNIALYRIYSDAIEALNLTEKEKAIAEALYGRKDVTVKFDIDGIRATGRYTTEQVIAAYTDGFPAPAPKGMDWENIVEIYTGKKDLCVYREDHHEEKEIEER